MVLRVTGDTTLAIDALKGTRPAALEVFAAARRGEIDLAFTTRLEYELATYTVAHVAELLGHGPAILGSVLRFDVSRFDCGDRFADENSVATPTPGRAVRLDPIDSDHLAGHLMAGRDVFVTSDERFRKAALAAGCDAVSPEQLMARLRPM